MSSETSASSTPPADDSAGENETLIPVGEIHDLLRSFNEVQMEKLADTLNYVGTSSGPIDDLSARVIRNANIKTSGDQGLYLYSVNGDKQLEFSLLVSPRAYGAFVNGPDGNVVLPAYLNPLECPPGISIQTRGSDKFKVAAFGDMEWECMVFQNQFGPKKERTFEYRVSGPPINQKSRDFATKAFQAVEERFQKYATDMACSSTEILTVPMTRCLPLQTVQFLFQALPLPMYVLYISSLLLVG
ncbi:hypothetical protein K435DRAFT_881277 [Dendrothele bispora CBS 962.96]|uniref:Uncharacterized protein n=1 Tax=Dendrothele bispora (strain CBS 962.96) TaxID=1314807 RepID=A0A4S8KIT9_DENBC|nr:hypothetical protein K435DRAFT_881277 [Dendrothele bispora CBS 962.96]